MLKNLAKNRFWLWKALETWGLAIYFIIHHSVGTFSSPSNVVLDKLDDPDSIFILACIGSFVLIYSLWDLNTYLYKPIVTMLLTGVWIVFMCAFIIHDWQAQTYVSFQSIYAGFILVSMIGEIINPMILDKMTRK